MHDPGQNSSSQSVSTAVRDLMRRKHVPERQHGRRLGEILGLTYSQAHRKLTGGGWTLEQLQKVVEHFGESLVSIGLGEVTSTAGGKPAGTMANGVFIVGDSQYRYPCILWLGERIHPSRRCDFVAYKDGATWYVVEAVRCPGNAVRHKLNKLEIVLRKTELPSVAIVESNRAEADELNEYLNESGFRSTVLSHRASMQRMVSDGNTFDAYVIDWMLGHRITDELITQIRSQPGSPAAIFVLTADVSASTVEQDELAKMIMKHDVQLRQKPLPFRTFAAELQKAVGD